MMPDIVPWVYAQPHGSHKALRPAAIQAIPPHASCECVPCASHATPCAVYHALRLYRALHVCHAWCTLCVACAAVGCGSASLTCLLVYQHRCGAKVNVNGMWSGYSFENCFELSSSARRVTNLDMPERAMGARMGQGLGQGWGQGWRQGWGQGWGYFGSCSPPWKCNNIGSCSPSRKCNNVTDPPIIDGTESNWWWAHLVVD